MQEYSDGYIEQKTPYHIIATLIICGFVIGSSVTLLILWCMGIYITNLYGILSSFLIAMVLLITVLAAIPDWNRAMKGE